MTDLAAAPAPLRVLLVDPDDRVRESLAGLLKIGRRCTIIGTAGSADLAIQLAAETRPDVVVVDPRLPEIDGAALIAQLRSVAPETRVLVLNWSDTADLSSGADGYARKTFRPHELIDAVIAATAPRQRPQRRPRPC
jgi:DNA-binding NarL/FixJ family response regulator